MGVFFGIGVWGLGFRVGRAGVAYMKHIGIHGIGVEVPPTYNPTYKGHWSSKGSMKGTLKGVLKGSSSSEDQVRASTHFQDFSDEDSGLAYLRVWGLEGFPFF